MSMLMLLPIVPTVILMVSPIRTQLWQYMVPFLAQNQMLLKVIRSETIAPLEWAVYFGAGFGLAALLWFAATRRYHQARLGIPACGLATHPDRTQYARSRKEWVQT